MQNSTDPDCFGFQFDNSYMQLPEIFYQKQSPTKVSKPEIALFNGEYAATLGLNSAALKKRGAQFLSGNKLCNTAEPIAQAYAGHQFGYFNMLGDGRAILLGEHITPQKQRVDIQLKGAGRTPYSRTGDGRAALGPMLREYIISEAMYALGIPTTRSLAVTTTSEAVYRENVLPGAVLTRVAASHIRVGTFQYAAATKNTQQLKALADYTINRHFPHLKLTQNADTNNPYLGLLKQVIDSKAALIAQWMHVGFIHGVMNTDNMSICGETIDYGPCAFMNAYHPDTVFSSIDANGRYAYSNQPKIARWNLVRFAEALLPLIDESQEKAISLATECLDQYPNQFLEEWLAGMRKKLGIFNQEETDLKLAEDLLMIMQRNKADFTNTFRSLSEDNIHLVAMYQDASFRNWLIQWKARLTKQDKSFAGSVELMQSVNPKVIARNHLVEEALTAAVEDGDMSLVHALLSALSTPYADSTHTDKYLEATEPAFEAEYKTFCGT